MFRLALQPGIDMSRLLMFSLLVRTSAIFALLLLSMFGKTLPDFVRTRLAPAAIAIIVVYG